MSAPKTFYISDFLTMAQIRSCIRLWKADRDHFHKRVLAEIVGPNMGEINRKLGQPNNPDYIAYAIEYAMTKASGEA